MRFRIRLFLALGGWLVAFPTLGATITVTNNSDVIATGDGVSLREAITSINNAANVNADVVPVGAYGTADAINFAIGSGAQTVNIPTTPLPVLVKPVVINGYTQPGGSMPNSAITGDNSVHLVTLTGVGLSSGSQIDYAFRLGAGSGGSTIRGLVINRFGTGGILVQSAGNTIAGNFIGVDAAGTATTVGNGANEFRGGIFVAVFSSTGGMNVVGSAAPADRNVISGNAGPQVTLAASPPAGTADGNTVSGNYIGTNAAGTAAITLVNPGVGISVQGSSSNLIGGITGTSPGGACTGSCNLISGTSYGISISGNGSPTDTNNNVIQGNLLGTNVAGTSAIGNQSVGIGIGGATGPVTVGGTTPAARNVIAGRGAASTQSIGIDIQNFGADPATVIAIVGNYIGTNSAGTAALGNGQYGIHIQNTSKIQIGGTVGLSAGACTGSCNVISGNGFGQPAAGDGIGLENSDQTRIQGNFIGVAADGTTALGNARSGVRTFSFGGPVISSGNVIGAATSGGAGSNIIANNASGAGVFLPAGVTLLDFSGVNNSILSNSIYNNTGAGIELATLVEPTVNDPCDPDTVPAANRAQNTPVLTSAITTGLSTTIVGTLDSIASQAFTVEFFSSPSAGAQARKFLGSTTVMTNGSCAGAFNTMLPVGVAITDAITATATDASGNTSELSASIAVVTPVELMSFDAE